MCGIIGYTGEKEALPVLLSGLRALEYRGYDSSGVALAVDGGITAVKAKGRIDLLEEKLKSNPPAPSFCGIGHTRWATHGAPSDLNAHPHSTGNLSLVHNGIIENYAEIEAFLSGLGYTFVSETDTEVAAKLVDHFYKKTGEPKAAIFAAAELLRGSYAFGVIFCDLPGKIYAIRRDSPLIVARCAHGSLIASDIPALLPYTKKYYRLPEDTVAVIDEADAEFFARDGKRLTLTEESVDWSVGEAQKSGYPHFMLKEISEEPEALRKTVSARLRDSLPDFSGIIDRVPERIHIVACGTAMHAGLIGKTLIERFARVPTEVCIASEFRYRDPILKENELVLLLSQSGETADTLAALRHAKKVGTPTLAIVNVIGSSVAREADRVLYTLAGPEIAVASTKAYSVQCALLTLIAVDLALKRGKMGENEARALTEILLKKVPEAVGKVIGMSGEIKALADEFTDTEHLFYIGRGVDCDLCAEGSLKLKEISYIHSEAYASGELKHGTISLVTDGVPVVAVMTDRDLAGKTLSGVREVRSRGAHLLVITTEGVKESLGAPIPCDKMITVPEINCEDCPDAARLLTLFPAVTALQLFAYHTAADRGLDVDKPRNLAKSVTVE